jgi:type IV secretory pathway VirB2 component (pilin)
VRASRLIPFFAAAVVTNPVTAWAAGAGGGGQLPWDGPINVLVKDMTGPFAFGISMLAFVVAGAILVFGGEISDFVRRLIYTVMVSAFLVTITNTAAALGIAGAVV